MTEAQRGAVTAALADFVTTFEELHRHLGEVGSSAIGDTACRRLVNELLTIDERLQSAAGAAFDAHDSQKRAESLARRTDEQQHELLTIGHSMHDAEMRMGETVLASQEALAKADKSKASDRHVPVSTIVEYAERISYSNAAPVGDVAFEGARQQGFFNGWGTPAPQQHMLALAHFARPTVPSSSTNQAAGGAAPTSKAPSFSESAAAVATTTAREADSGTRDPSKRAHVSLELNSDDDDDDF